MDTSHLGPQREILGHSHLDEARHELGGTVVSVCERNFKQRVDLQLASAEEMDAGEGRFAVRVCDC